MRRGRELADAVARPSVRAAPGPIPPRRLRARVGAPGAREFVGGGRAAANALDHAVRIAGVAEGIAGVGSILDFGCGCGRVLAHVATAAPGVRCTGCDVDGGAITWAARHLLECDWLLSAYTPPLPFADASFALAYSVSVFSHLGEQGQRDWLRELARVLAPEGIALLSVHGPYAFEQFRRGQVRTAWCPPEAFAGRGSLAAEEFAFVAYRRSLWNALELPGIGAGYGLAFHGAQYLERSWGEVFEVVDVRERALADWQDLVVCRTRS